MAEPHNEDLLPVRRINDLVYCPRRFWLEEVAGAWDDNAHTVKGQQAHKRVDAPGGTIITAEEADGVDVVERGTWLSSEAIGVSAKLDRVLADPAHEGAVLPVDTKKGKPPHEPDTLWPADDVQVTLQGLLLRSAGHRVERVAVYYAAERTRIAVPLDAQREARAREAVAEARRVFALDVPPSPLLDSPKCPGCSLNAICQPDEVNALVGRSAWDGEAELRRVVPQGTDAKPLCINEPGARVGADHRALVVEPLPGSLGKKQRVGMETIDHVCVLGTAQLSTGALRALLEAGVPVAFLSSSGWLAGVAVGEESRAVGVRIAQHKAYATDAALAIARVLIADKIENQRTILRRNAGDEGAEVLARMKRLAAECSEATSSAALLALEAEAAKRYWEVFASLAGRDEPAFLMKGRTRRPPRDATNAMISFASGVLAKDCTLAARMVGLDPYLGVFHTPTHGRPSMALDLMEPFRALVVDSVVLGVIRRKEVRPNGFVNNGQAVTMDKDTRRALAVAYERRLQETITHPLFGYRITYRQVLGVQARLLARALTGEISSMPSFRTR